MRIILLILIIVCSQCGNDNIDTYIKTMQIKINDLAQKVLQQFNASDVQNCTTKSYNQCLGTSQLICYQNFASQQYCLSPGQRLSKISAIRLVPKIDIENLTNEQKYVVCATAKIQSQFNSLTTSRNKDYLTAYIGTSTGMYRSHPTIKYQGDSNFSCQYYDPRFRPWYTDAITGLKNMVLLIDNSGGQQIESIKIAAESLVRTFVTNDSISVISFNDTVTYLSSKQIVRMNKIIQIDTINAIKRMTTGQAANYTKAFEAAFSQLTKSDQEQSLCCKKDVVFVLFTDGKSLNEYEQALNGLIKKNNKFNVQLFIFSFTNNTNNAQYQSLINLACSNKGVYYKIGVSTSIISINLQLSQMYTVMAKNQNFTKPKWSQFYNDAFDRGRIITITKPIYDNNRDYLIGVVGIDSPLSKWIQLGQEVETQIKRRTSQGATIYSISSNNTCDFQNFRPNQYRCKQCNQSESFDFPNITVGIFREPQTDSAYRCCGITKGALVGVIIGPIIFLALVVGLIVYCCWKRPCRQKSQEEYGQTNRPYLPPPPIRMPEYISNPPPGSQNYIIDARLPIPPPHIFAGK